MMKSKYLHYLYSFKFVADSVNLSTSIRNILYKDSNKYDEAELYKRVMRNKPITDDETVLSFIQFSRNEVLNNII